MRTIVMSIGDNKVADAFVEGLLRLQDPNSDMSGQQHQALALWLVGMIGSAACIDAYIARPTKSCSCKPAKKGWRKAKRFGWYICPVCKKPSATVVDSWVENMTTMASDLLPEVVFKIHSEEPKEGEESESVA